MCALVAHGRICVTPTLGFGDLANPIDAPGIMGYPPQTPNQSDIDQLSNSSFLPEIIEQ